MRDLVREILGESGPVARHLGGGYEARDEQIAMGRGVAQSMAARGTLIAEAGTGVGKSFAYLVPAILRCVANGETVVVSTHTINLQEQLIKKDIPLLMETLGDGSGWGLDPGKTVALRPVLVKGRGNYLSRRRLKLADERADRLFDGGAERRTLKVIQQWAEGTDEGTLSSLPALERYGVWSSVQSDSDNCMGRKCRTYETCFYQRARRAMEKGNLLVCNHALFFADLRLRAAGEGENGGGGFLPSYHHVVLDEAHTVEDVASDHFGLTMTESRIERLLTSLYNPQTGRGYLGQVGLVATSHEGGIELLDRCVQGVAEAQGASRAYFEGVVNTLRSGRLRNGRVTNADLIGPVDGLVLALKSLNARLLVLRDSIKNDEDRFELNAFAVRANAAAFDADVLGNQKQEGCVYWVEGGGGGASDGGEWGGGGSGRGGLRRVGAKLKLACSPIEVGPLLRQHLFNKEIGIVLTSATIATAASGAGVNKGSTLNGYSVRRVVPVEEEDVPVEAPPVEINRSDPFAHCRKRLGVEVCTSLQVGSPFDYREQVRVIVDGTVPDPRSGKGKSAGATANPGGEALTFEQYINVLCERILHHVDQTDGGAFVLFTSFATLNACADRVRPSLAMRKQHLFVQGTDGPPARVLEAFKATPRGVLFGAASFWQGVDVRGDTLRNVIITKLPFDPPDRPLVEARCDLIKARGGDPFKEESLPRALLRFRQGFGRLIRSRTDTGQVVILDGRVVGTGYGRLFLHALPAGVKVETLRTPSVQRAAQRGPAGYGGRQTYSEPE